MTVRMGRSTIAALVFLAGCVDFDRSLIDEGEDGGGLDGGRADAGMDAGRSDGGPLDAAGLDAGALDAGDAALADGGLPDAGVDAGPDAGPFDAGHPSICESQFGAATGYLACGATATECTFYRSSSPASCDQVCAVFDGSCAAAYDDGLTGATCHTTPIDCSVTRSDSTCVCTLPGAPPPPDAGPPTGPAARCIDEFGALPDFVLCTATATTCEFYASAPSGGADCRDLCGASFCAAAFRVASPGCSGSTPESCGREASDHVCRCRLD